MNLEIKIYPKDTPLKREYISYLVRRDFRIKEHTWNCKNEIISLLGKKDKFVSWIDFDKEN